MTPVNTGALAVQPVMRPQVSSVAAPARPAANLARAVQRSLFQERPASNVVPIESYVPPTRPRVSHEARPPRPASRRGPRVPEGQGSLDFLPQAPAKPRTLDTTVEAMIYCEERVAAAPHRFVSAAADWALVFIAYGIFLTTAYFSVGGFPLIKANLPILGAVWPLFGLLYSLLWALAGTETPGMRFARLRLTTFEGETPEANQRLLRFVGSCLSLSTVIGVLWSLADEEGLGWQDHMSRTFPTPRRHDSQVFHRR